MIRELASHFSAELGEMGLALERAKAGGRVPASRVSQVSAKLGDVESTLGRGAAGGSVPRRAGESDTHSAGFNGPCREARRGR